MENNLSEEEKEKQQIIDSLERLNPSKFSNYFTPVENCFSYGAEGGSISGPLFFLAGAILAVPNLVAVPILYPILNIRVARKMKKCDENLLQDVDFMKKVFEVCPNAFKCIQSKRLAAKLVGINEKAIKYLPKKFRKDRDIVKAALERNLDSLQYAPKKFKNDKELILNGISDNSQYPFPYASKKLRNNRDFVLEAVEKNYWVLEDTKLSRNKKFVKEAISRECYAYNALPEKLRYDRDIAYYALQCGYPLSKMPETFEDDETFQITAINQGCSLEKMPESAKNNTNVVKAAIIYDPENYEYASEKVRQDMEVAKMAVAADPENMWYVIGHKGYDYSTKSIVEKDLPLHIEFAKHYTYDYKPSGHSDDEGFEYDGCCTNWQPAKYTKELLLINRVRNNPANFDKLPTSMFQESNKQFLEACIDAVKLSLKDLASDNITEEIETYSKDIMAMVSEKIAKEKSIIKHSIQEENEKAKDVAKNVEKAKDFRESLDNQFNDIKSNIKE